MTIDQVEQHVNNFEKLFKRFTFTLDNLPLIAKEIEDAEKELARLDKANEQLHTLLKKLPGTGTAKLKTAMRIEINRAKIHNALFAIQALSNSVETMLTAFKA